MKNQTLIGLAATTLIALATIPAWSGEENNIGYALQIQRLQMRCQDLEEGIKTYDSFVKESLYRVDELERKVSGMQKQITILHAKKADKAAKAGE